MSVINFVSRTIFIELEHIEYKYSYITNPLQVCYHL